MCWLIALFIIMALIGIAVYFGGEEAIVAMVAGTFTIAVALLVIILSCLPYIIVAFVVILMLKGFGVV